MEAARSGFGVALAGGATGGRGPGVGRRYMESMVGLSAAPNGVDRKSVGRSADHWSFSSDRSILAHL
jgi:hypothetical protein